MMGRFLLLLSLWACRATSSTGCEYSADLVSFDGQPVLSFLNGTSEFQQVFNPSWVVGSAGTGGKAGLIVRTQNCSSVGDECARCGGTGDAASILTFSELLSDDGTTTLAPRFAPLNASSVVFGPHDLTDDQGTEDPRIAFDSSTGLYYMLYTCYNSGQTSQDAVTLCMATTTDPTKADGWTLLGPLGFGDDTKSGALLIRDEPEWLRGAVGPHFLYWGVGTIHVTSSYNLTSWTPGQEFITNTAWGNPNVEAGPPPLRLSTGDFVFFINSWGSDWPDKGNGYQPGWVVLDGDDPSIIVASAQKPLWDPSREPWLVGVAPWTCNVPNVTFLEAAHPTEEPDTFRVYFGGADAVVGTALVKVTPVGEDCGRSRNRKA